MLGKILGFSKSKGKKKKKKFKSRKQKEKGQFIINIILGKEMIK